MAFKLFRNKTFVLIVIVALFGGLAYFSADYDSRGASGSKCLIEVYGKCYRQQDVERLAQYSRVARELFLVEFQRSLFGVDRLDQDPTDFVTNLLVLRKEAERLQIEPTLEQAKEAIASAPIFSFGQGITDEDLERNLLAPLGLTKADLVQLGKDYVAWQQINDLLAAGTQPVAVEIDKAYVRDNQQFSASRFEFLREGFTDKVEITDEQIQEFFDANQENLLSDEKRSLTMVTFVPPGETEEMTAEQKAEQRLAFNNRVNDIYANAAEVEPEFRDRIQEAAGAEDLTFEIKIEEIASFAAVSPPEGLEGKDEILADIFSPARDTEPGRSVTVPYPMEDGGYVMFQITEVTPPAPLTLDESREQIVTALTARESNLLVNEAATAARTKVLEALDAGKPLAEAAKAAGVEPQEMAPFSRNEPPAETDGAAQLVSAALSTPAGSVSDVLPLSLGQGYHFLFVEKSELVESEEEASRKESLRFTAEREYRRLLYQSWFDERLREAGVVRAGPVVPELAGAGG